MNIELYSVKGFIGHALKRKLEEALQDHRMPYTINEIHQVDQFIKAGLASVPAIKIEDKVIQHPPDGVIDKTVEEVMEYILGEKINTILVPVDFSEESDHAIEYAIMMAQVLGMGITLAHVHQTLYDPISSGALDVQILEDNQKRLAELVDSINAEHKVKDIYVPVMAHLEVGEASSSLIGLLDHGRFDLMIIGTKASDSIIRRMFGTVSSDVSRHSRKPVLVVPPQAEIKFPGKMVVGFTEELMLDGALEYILTFGAKNNVIFDFIHVLENHDDFKVLKNNLQEKLVVHRDLLSGYNIRSLTDEDHKIHESLFGYAHKSRAGMVILVSHHRNFLEDIQHSSVTRKALLNPTMPVLVIHQPIGK